MTLRLIKLNICRVVTLSVSGWLYFQPLDFSYWQKCSDLNDFIKNVALPSLFRPH